jgi:hypothetical protein
MAKRFALIIAMFLIPALARADSVWQYQGNAASAPPFIGFISEGFALSGTVLLNNNEQAIGWNFVAGPDIFTNFNSSGVINPFACTSCTNQMPFASWDIFLLTNPGQYFYFGNTSAAMMSFSNAQGAFDGASNHDGSLGQVYVLGNPGTWTEVISTPEPGSLLLLGAGVTALALAISLRSGLA